MIKASFKLILNELDNDFIEKLKSMFSKNKVVEINIQEEVDETEYLLSTKANCESLLKSLEQLKNKEFVSKQMNELEA